jgi:hypothetical protein
MAHWGGYFHIDSVAVERRRGVGLATLNRAKKIHLGFAADMSSSNFLFRPEHQWQWTRMPSPYSSPERLILPFFSSILRFSHSLNICAGINMLLRRGDFPWTVGLEMAIVNASAIPV